MTHISKVRCHRCLLSADSWDRSARPVDSGVQNDAREHGPWTLVVNDIVGPIGMARRKKQTDLYHFRGSCDVCFVLFMSLQAITKVTPQYWYIYQHKNTDCQGGTAFELATNNRTKQEDQLLQSDRSTRCVIWNFVNCCKTRQKIPLTICNDLEGHSRWSELPLFHKW